MDITIYKPGVAQPETAKRGVLCGWYGGSGVGKTATVLQTAVDPIFWIIVERSGQEELTLKAIGRPNLRLKVGTYKDFNDLVDVIYDLRYFAGIKSLLFDSMTHVMSIHLADEILSENYEAMSDKDKITKDLTARAKMSQEGYGVLSKQMVRLMKGFEALTHAGIDCHLLFRDTENPKWDRSLACAPSLSGKEFSKDMKGFFDFIGLIETRINPETGQIVYPPAVSCQDTGSYMSKWTGVIPAKGLIRRPFHIQRMLAIARGEDPSKVQA